MSLASEFPAGFFSFENDHPDTFQDVPVETIKRFIQRVEEKLDAGEQFYTDGTGNTVVIGMRDNDCKSGKRIFVCRNGYLESSDST